MSIQELQTLYGRHPQVMALRRAVADESVQTMVLTGLQASAAAMVFGGLQAVAKEPKGRPGKTFLFVLQDADEAGYFYHDLCQVMGDAQVLTSPAATAVPSSTARRMPPARYCAPRCSRGSVR